MKIFSAICIVLSLGLQTLTAQNKPASPTKPAQDKKENKDSKVDPILEKKIKSAVKPEEQDYSNLPPIKLVEKISKKENELVVPYEKHVLANGLTIIVHEDHSDPIVDVDVTYHVGSNREQIGKSGFAHFFEHMMFQGSEHVGDDQHFKIVSEAGGTLNGTTNSDRTNYFETLPSNQLEVALWLESDRMGFLLDSVTQIKFENQRSTVKNERGQNYDNRPYGLVSERTDKAFFPYGHPYSWPTIGYIEDLNRSDVDDLKKFFMRWYGPNNATITIAGDVNTAEALKLVEKYFGPIPRGPITKPMPPLPVTIETDRYISLEDNIRFPMLQFAYPGVEAFGQDEAALDVLASIIAEGKNSILYKNMVKAEKSISADASNQTSELAGQFVISARAFPDKPLSEIETLIREGLTEFEKRGVTEDDLVRFKAAFEAQQIRRLESVSGKARLLALYQTFTGNPNYIKTDLERYRRVTKDDVMKAYYKYIKGKYAVILSVFPKGKSQLAAKPDNYSPPTTGLAFTQVDYSGLVYKKPKDTFDRSKKPAPGNAKSVTVPDFWTENLENGMKIIGAKNAEVPTVSMLFMVEAGHIMESHDMSRAGISYLLAAMMNEGSKKFTAEQFEDTLKKLGSSINVSSDDRFINVSVSSLTKNLSQTISLMDEKIFNPKFEEADFNRLKTKQLENISNQATQPTVMAWNAYNEKLYGKAHILSVPNIGSAESVKTIELADLKNYYKTYFTPATATLSVVGDINKEDITGKISSFKSWSGKAPKAATLPPTPVIEKTKVFLVDKDRAPQSEIRIGTLSLPYDATGDYYKCTVMNYTLGGAFSSRINLNLREDKGWTYGARASFSGDKITGTYTASAGVRGDATDSSIVEFMKELTNFRDKGISESELSFTKQAILQRDALRYETSGQKLSFLKLITTYDLDKSFLATQNEILNKITKPEIDALAKKYLPVDKMNIVIVGDNKNLKMKLMKLGYEVVDLSPKDPSKEMPTNFTPPKPNPAPAPGKVPPAKEKGKDKEKAKEKNKEK